MHHHLFYIYYEGPRIALGGLAVSLGSVTSYITSQNASSGMKAAYNAVKVNISIPVVDQILRKMSQSSEAVCSLAARGMNAAMSAYQRRATLRSAADESQSPSPSQPAEVQQSAEAQAKSEEQAIVAIHKQIKKIVGSGALSPEHVDRIITELRNAVESQGGSVPSLAQSDGEEEMKAERGGRRRKRGTRKPRKGKMSKTAKGGRKGKSKRKASKGKMSRKTRRGRK